jgi:tRNA nucleotidyltransferase (CCA-adding enzyme)
VRDRLLGLPVTDHDWVVVGATAEQMLGAGYTPVGRDFPVFLHPDTKDEHALARTERKSGPGYRGFAVQADPSVTLEQDLARRDLTINAIAQAEDGTLIDPYGGQRDLQDGVLRHVSAAFTEDPVRILRLARFTARWPRFRVAAETTALCRQMVADGEADALVAERVWQELSRGLMESQPSRMFEVLRDCGALVRVLPEVACLWGVPQPAAHHPEVDTGVHLMLVLDTAAHLAAPLPVRWACLVHDLGKGSTPPAEWPRHIAHEARSDKLADALAERLRVPTDCRELGAVVAREHGNIHGSAMLGAAATLRLFERCDALRRPERFGQALLACECDARGRLGLQDVPYPQRTRLAAALRVALAVDVTAAAAAAAERGATGPAIGDAVRRAREQALAAAM